MNIRDVILEVLEEAVIEKNEFEVPVKNRSKGIISMGPFNPGIRDRGGDRDGGGESGSAGERGARETIISSVQLSVSLIIFCYSLQYGGENFIMLLLVFGLLVT